jgi:beta-lactamase class D
MGNKITTTLCLAALVCLVPAGAAEAGGGWKYGKRADLTRYFEEAGTDGTMVVRKESGHTVLVNADRAHRRYLPASTFKIPNTLIALAMRIAEGPEHVFRGPREPYTVDGEEFLPAECNGDITLRDAFRLSCVNVYQEIARQVGGKAYRKALRRMDYGNEDTSGAAVDQFWLEGDLAISAREQVAFLRRLDRHRLDYRHRDLRDVEEVMVSERQEGYVIRSKTGWGSTSGPDIGWWVGWVETRDEVAYFALNLDITRPEHVDARKQIGKAILRDLGVLPA